MNLKSNKAITLVALIITIIILLILAGVTLSMVLGDNGLIDKAQSSVEKYQEGANNEQKWLSDIEYDVYSYGLPDNKPDTPAGTQVKPPRDWMDTPVIAVADGKGNIFPVPKNFYYVGGDYTNGVIISDDPADTYDGITDKTTWEYTTSLVGNQFVWIPCTEEEYHKTSWGSSYVYGGYDTSGPTDEEKAKVLKYGGFYVARYEAGLADTITEFTAAKQISNGTNSPEYNVIGIPKSQAGQVPWNFINYTNSKKNAENMYNTNEKFSDYVTSGLITGTQWDVMLKKIIGTTNENGVTFAEADMTNSNNWGNYTTNSIPYEGRLARCNYDGANWYMYPFGSRTTGNTQKYANNGYNGDLLTTGASIYTEAYHTYDLAGNIWERTLEIGQGTNYFVVRSGDCANVPVGYSAAIRSGTISSDKLYWHIRISCGTLYKVVNKQQ